MERAPFSLAEWVKATNSAGVKRRIEWDGGRGTIAKVRRLIFGKMTEDYLVGDVIEIDFRVG